MVLPGHAAHRGGRLTSRLHPDSVVTLALQEHTTPLPTRTPEARSRRGGASGALR